MRRAFERADGFEVIAEAETLSDARAKARALSPEVVVLDVRLPDGNGLDLCREIRDNDPAVGVVILTMLGGDSALLDSHGAGASAYVSKDAPARDVVAAARRAAETPSEFVAEGYSDAVRRRRADSRPSLTAREQEVLELLAEGLGIAAISRRLFISESTTKTHVSKIYGKLGASNRAQVLMTAIRLGLIDQG